MAFVLRHYGTPRHSGRYPWGSGDNPQQHNSDFLGQVEELKKKGLSEVEIAKGLGMSTSQLRAKKSIAKNERKAAEAAEAVRLKAQGLSNVEIGKQMGKNESSIRALLEPSAREKAAITDSVSKVLKDSVAKKDYVDIGVGTEAYLGVSRTKLKASVEQLKEEGYTVHYVQVEQLGTAGNKTSVMVLAKPGVEYGEVYRNRDKIRMVTDYRSEDGGRTFLGMQPIQSISSDRIKVRYGDQGGAEKDGVIELRRGVDDISLGGAKYAQVRIGVDGTHYLKGMAVYSDNIPDGVDIVFNTNKNSGTPKMDVLKKMKDDPDNKFGATIKSEDQLRLAQRYYTDKNGEKRLSAINVVNEEGDWDKWSKTLSSQMLSKQPTALAKKQLDLAYSIKKAEFDEINSLTNPAVKKRLFDSFADDCDAAAVHMKAAALPRQKSHVILPIPSLSEKEIYAPNYKTGENVVLIRYPHGGKFEIPELVVNNRNREAKSILGDAKDAVGINSKVAERLSGADFDGDTVLVIPNPNRSVKTSPALKGLKDFDPKTAYPKYDGMKVISSRSKQIEMGKVSNLITDMTIKGATDDEICRAVKHSMVVIDAEKHELNYKQSYVDNGIAELKKKYQGGGGASTIISKASSETRVGVRKEKIDPKTGAKIYEYTGETYANRAGKTVLKTVQSKKMAEVSDARELSSGYPIENTYASYANSLKALANESRKISVNTPNLKYSPEAKKTYAKEVKSLKAQLDLAIKNKPLERQAQIIANGVVRSKKRANPDMDNDTLKKVKSQALAEARSRVGASKYNIHISDREWEAIQAGAVSHNTLTSILNNTDLDRVKQLATPRTSKGMATNKISKAKSMLRKGYTQAEVADALGVSVSTLMKAIE